MLTKYQRNNYQRLQFELKYNNELVIVGSPNSGRKYVVKELANNLNKCIIIDLKTTCINSPYSALITALKDIDFFNKKRLNITPTFSITSMIGNVDFSLEASVVFKIETEIINALLKAAKKRIIVFIIDKLHNINDGSIELINKFININRKKEKVYVIYISDVAVNNAKNLYFEHIPSQLIHFKELLNELNLSACINLSDKVLNFIQANINNNIGLLIQIINDLNAGNLDCSLSNYDKNEILNSLLEYSNKKYEYKEQLIDLLSICSITDHYFQSIDLAYLLKEHESIIELILEYAQKTYLLEKSENSFRIIFGIVNKIYSNLSEIDKRNLYIRMVDMIVNVHPSKYYLKYSYAKLANIKNYSNFLVQHIFSEIRLNHGVNIDRYIKELSDEQIRLITSYNKSVGYNNSEEYDKSLEELSAVNYLNSEFFYEINILKSQALIKKMNKSYREMAVSILDYDNNLIDENLKFRLDIRKIATLVHVGKYFDAKNVCNKTRAYLVTKLETTHSLEYEYCLNVIHRKISCVETYDLSINYVEKSVAFFREYQSDYFNGYYISLINLLSLYIVNMQLDKASKTKKEIEDLIITKNNVNFPRKEILYNNVFLYYFFTGTKTISDICSDYKKLYDETKGCADHILIASNYAVFLMLNNDCINAEKILDNTAIKTDNDLEGIYDTRIKINLAICKFLISNENRAQSILMLDSIEYNTEAPFYKVRSEELSNIRNLIKKIDYCNDANKWCEEFKKNILTPLSTYTTYQQGFIYTTLFNWDDD